MRILVVEDEKDLNRIITKTLSKSGYTVDSCFDGNEVEHYLAGAEYDAILMDVMLPGKDGFSLVSAMREREIGRAHV